jgi:DNA-binding transcriptional regulator YiaG
MSPEMLELALEETGLPVQEFARISGYRADLIRAWLHGEKEIPHTAFVLLSMLTLPGAVERAKRVTNLVAKLQKWEPEGPTNE